MVHVDQTSRGIGSLKLIRNYISFALSCKKKAKEMIADGEKNDVILGYQLSPITSK